ncbi:hypothetical protein [Haloplanus aerogenes]|uniref:Uncharacterized protein n=1 Tax=Haloplanus aerogenes TaxID=660522 RepID=A0A3M0DA75_9EURY|nr:hypothetical protein [Haloplanus aerogenes]AZH26044.1 hypothetical protein DU502_12040 [Haloplanus aerogenes]RMB18512.1 hypothetical protein ATH50_1973 [Haloplanus aerogenes]
MNGTRRMILAVIDSSLTAGCLTDGDGNGTTPSPTPSSGGPTTQNGGTPSPIPSSCDPADVSHPPVVEESNHPAMGYGTKPQELTQQSVADYLADFETAYAWNRILDDHSPVARLNIDTTTPWNPEPAGAGFLASSGIETSYTPEGSEESSERAYVASYYVSPDPVYRVQTEAESVDPRSHPDRQLVQCGTDTKK